MYGCAMDEQRHAAQGKLQLIKCWPDSRGKEALMWSGTMYFRATWFRTLLVLLVTGWTTSAWADWRFSDSHQHFGNAPTAEASDSSGHTLALMCREGEPTLTLSGYSANTRNELSRPLDVLVDGIGYRLDSTHAPSADIWVAEAPRGLLTTLQSGKVAVVTPHQGGAARFSLNGASAPIDQVLTACR